MPKKAGIITQARMGSSRLPGKIFKTINAIPLLEYHLNRLQESHLPIVVATTVETEDDQVVEYCRTKGVEYYRGDMHDVLSRFYITAKKFNFETIVRVTSDCPLIDGGLIASAMKEYEAWHNSKIYYSNCINRTFPRGFDFEIFSFEALEDAHNHAKDSGSREHVTPYINRNVSGEIELKHLLTSPDLSEVRLTVDELDDFKLIETLIRDSSAQNKSYKEIAQLFINNPELSKINNHINQKKH